MYAFCVFGKSTFFFDDEIFSSKANPPEEDSLLPEGIIEKQLLLECINNNAKSSLQFLSVLRQKEGLLSITCLMGFIFVLSKIHVAGISPVILIIKP